MVNFLFASAEDILEILDLIGIKYDVQYIEYINNVAVSMTY